MTLDELREATDEASDNGAPPGYGVVVCLGDKTYGIDRVDHGTGDGVVRIHLEGEGQ